MKATHFWTHWRNCSFWHFCFVFMFQVRRLLLSMEHQISLNDSTLESFNLLVTLTKMNVCVRETKLLTHSLRSFHFSLCGTAKFIIISSVLKAEAQNLFSLQKCVCFLKQCLIKVFFCNYHQLWLVMGSIYLKVLVYFLTSLLGKKKMHYLVWDQPVKGWVDSYEVSTSSLRKQIRSFTCYIVDNAKKMKKCNSL